MKKTKVHELKTKTKDELENMLIEKEKDLTNQRMGIATKKQKNTRLLKSIRGEIARVKTVLREKELEEKNV